jgi:uncharacterized protein
MRTIWDESKRRSNLRKHGLDFRGCEAIFDRKYITFEDTRRDYGEQRFNVIGLLASKFVILTYTERGDDLRVISLRPATKDEIRDFFVWV